MKTRKILALLLALAMVFSMGLIMTACDDDNGDDTSNGNEDNGNGGGNGNDYDTPIDFPDSASFDFAVIEFNEREFTLPMAARRNIGDNLDRNPHDAADIIKLAFFQQATIDAEGPYADYAFLVSQNGEFWSNISRIEADFFLSGASEDAEAEHLGFFQVYIQGGGLGVPPWDFWNTSADEDNLINQIPGVADEDVDRGFEFGDIMTAVWDITEFGRDRYRFSDPPEEIPNDNEDEDDETMGFGVLKFGLQTGNDDIEDHRFGFHWHDVRIFVYDLELFNEFVEQVSEIRGFGPSPNTEGKVFEVSR